MGPKGKQGFKSACHICRQWYNPDKSKVQRWCFNCRIWADEKCLAINDAGQVDGETLWKMKQEQTNYTGEDRKLRLLATIPITRSGGGCIQGNALMAKQIFTIMNRLAEGVELDQSRKMWIDMKWMEWAGQEIEWLYICPNCAYPM